MQARVRRHAWEEQHAWADVDSDEEADPETDPGAASLAFVDAVMELYMTSAISAMTFAVICYWASKAGVSGPARDYGMRPGLPNERYQQHLNPKLGFNEARKYEYTLDTPAQLKSDFDRSTYHLPTRPLHERAQEEMQNNPSLKSKLDECIAGDEMPRAYFEHPVVMGAPNETILPWGLYLDAVQYSLTDSILGIWLINFLTRMRHLVLVFRKRLFCQCGCRGWSTVYPIHVWLRWCIDSMARGVFPAQRHNGCEWRPCDNWRASLAGTALKFKGAIIQIRGDWAEFCERFAFPTWASALRHRAAPTP